MLLYISFALATAEGQSKLVQTITIRSSWGGLGTPRHSRIVIQREGNHYVANDRTIRKEEVQALLNAIEEPRISAPNGTNLGVTSQWLQNHSEEAGEYAIVFNYQAGSAQQKELFRSSFTSDRTIQKRLDSLYASFHTDDYPHMAVELTFEDGTSQTAKSDSQHPFMVPWSISHNGVTAETYNANISRALLTLLPSEFANREALTDEQQYATGLLQELAQETGSEVETRWKGIGAQDRAGNALRSLKKTYQVRRADVNSYHGLDFGKEWAHGEPQEENLHVDLWRPGFPKNFIVTAVLQRHKEKVEGADVFQTKAAPYEELVLSIDWLRNYWNTHPNEYAQLLYVHGHSFTDKAMEIFSADMKDAGRPDLIARVRAVQDRAALLQTASKDYSIEFGNGDYWIVLPDKSMILWRWQSSKNILRWNQMEFSAHECSAYGTVTGGCSGTLISPSGKIIPQDLATP
jgi:hypothetical protein